MNNQKVAVLIPALDEEENLKWLLPQVMENFFTVVIDNDSEDRTAFVAKSLGAHVVACANRGYGSAVLAGLRYLEEERPKEVFSAYVILDADGTSPVDEIEAIVDPVLKHQADLSIGQRVHQQKGAMPAHAKFGNWLQVSLIQLFTGFQYRDMGPLRALSPRAIQRLKMEDKTWGWNVEMQVKAPLLNLKIVEHEIVYMARRFGHSKISGSVIGSLRAGGKILFAVAWYFLRTRYTLAFRKHYSKGLSKV